MRLRPGTWGLALLLSARAVAATPQEPSPPFALAVTGCGTTVDEARLRAQLVIELRTLQGQPQPLRIALTCAGVRLAVSVGPVASGGVARSELALADAPESTRPRLLALAITELVAPGREPPPSSVLVPPPAPSSSLPTAAGAPAVVASAGAAPPSAPAVRLYVETSLRRMATPTTWLGGLGVGAERPWRSWLALALELTVEAGSTETAPATVSWRQGALVAGLAFGAGKGRVTWAVEPGFGVALLGLAAGPVAPGAHASSFAGVWAGPEVAARVRCALGRFGFVQLQGKGGYLTRTVVGLADDTNRLVDVSGPWASVGLGVGVVY